VAEGRCVWVGRDSMPREVEGSIVTSFCSFGPAIRDPFLECPRSQQLQNIFLIDILISNKYKSFFNLNLNYYLNSHYMKIVFYIFCSSIIFLYHILPLSYNIRPSPRGTPIIGASKAKLDSIQVNLDQHFFLNSNSNSKNHVVVNSVRLDAQE
jgi:hypothetical protein